MNADTDIQVWLETEQRTQPQIIIPYIKSPNSQLVRYTVETVRVADQGRTQLRQSGAVKLGANQAAALGRIAISRSPEDNCVVTLTLLAGHRLEKRYRISCPD